ncbi:MAG TPA: hypothetical protein VI757_13215 [Bacteroidia bacterium]|nr:hypothetical protein [Bacteroidia bacterium]
MKTQSKIIMLIACITLFISCAKDGEIGPQGAQGTQGTQGATGNTGPQGPGASSQTITVTSNQWSHFGTQGQSGDGYQTIQNVSIITSGIVSTGAVLAYISGSTTAWVALPYSAPYSSWQRYWTYAYQTGQIILECQDSDFFTTQPGTQYFKVVVIPGSVMHQNPDVDFNNYKEVQAAYNLQD